MDEQAFRLLYKLRFVLGGALIVACLFLLSFILSFVTTPNQAQAASATTASGYTDTGSDNNDPNIISQFMSESGNAVSRATSSAQKGLSSSLHTVTTSIMSVPLHGSKIVASGAVASAKFIGKDTGHAFSFIYHVPGKILNKASPSTLVSTTLRPADNMSVPTITQMRAQQAQIIQSGTKQVPVAQVNQMAGGACDAGGGNGDYPLAWCNAPMDSVATVPFSSDRINRECTSYAYWYFATIEGHSDLRVHGNAKYWAATSNYPVHATPAVGAIAVETAGAYGHVAIVQALSGQLYDGKVVPAGDILVSEMNYDWNGHFRYSYSPLAKFQAYIYR